MMTTMTSMRSRSRLIVFIAATAVVVVLQEGTNGSLCGALLQEGMDYGTCCCGV
jgi:hypothetical protein